MTLRDQRTWLRQQREHEAEQRQAAAQQRTAQLQEALAALLSCHDPRRHPLVRVDLTRLHRRRPEFDAAGLDQPVPEPVYVDPGGRWLASVAPGWWQRRSQAATAQHAQAMEQWRAADDERRRLLQERRAAYEAAVARVDAHNRRLDETAANLRSGKKAAVEFVLATAIQANVWPANAKPAVVVRYLPGQRELFVEALLPLAAQVVPAHATWRYVKTRNSLEPVAHKPAEVTRIYRTLLACLSLRIVLVLLRADEYGHVDSVSFKAVVEGIDPSTGKPCRPILVSLKTTRADFLDRDFSQIEPDKALQSLRARVSPSPTEFVAVMPIVEFDIDDPRFIAEQDIAATLSTADNLMDLTPSQFEQFVTNLFNAMGFEAYPTCTSKDGGVDCVAYKRDVIAGGKYIVQAKLYSKPVGVSAVRDLAGAIGKEQANKGILITSHRFTADAHKWAADDHRIQLIEGPQLLALVEKYTTLNLTIRF